MNNSKADFKQEKEFLETLIKLKEKKTEKFLFLEAFLTAVVNKEGIKILMSLNEDTHTVLVLVGDHMHKEIFNTVEEANSFIDGIRNIKKKMA